jgi:uncharacterized protein YjbI with pentapeptide repeats
MESALARCISALVVALCLWLIPAVPAAAQLPYDENQEAEAWAWSQIKLGKPADFNAHCGVALDPFAEAEPRWAEPCRRVSATFLANVLTRAPWLQEVAYAGVYISGARIEGDLDLRYARLERPLTIEQCRLENDLNFSGVRTNSPIGLIRSRVAGVIEANQLSGERWLELGESVFNKDVRLMSAKIDANIGLDGAAFNAVLDMDSAQVGGHLLARSASFHDVSLAGVKVTANLHLGETQVSGKLNTYSLQVGGHLGARAAKLADVDLSNAKIGGNVDLDEASIEGDLNGDTLQIGGHLFMRSTDQRVATFRRVDLHAAKIVGNLEMDRASVSDDLIVNTAQVGAHLLTRSASFKGIDLSGTRITGNADLGSITAEGDLDASAIQVGGHLILSSSRLKTANLRSAKVTGNLEILGATFDGDLNADSLQIGAHLFIRPQNNTASRFKGVNLSGAKISGEVDLDGATFSGHFNADSIRVEDHFLARSTTFKTANLSNAELSRNVAFEDCTFEVATLDPVRIKGNFALMDSRFRDQLILNNTQVDGKFILNDRLEIDKVALSGFVFASAEWGARPLDRLDNIIRVTTSGYSPRFYDALAKAYSDTGQAEIARSVLVRKRNDEYGHSEEPWWSAYLFLAWLTTGYGYRPVLGLIWIGIFTGIAALFFKLSSDYVVGDKRPRNWLIFSLDAVIPVIHLDKTFDDVQFRGWRQYALYFLRFLGAIVIVLIIEVLKQSISDVK